MYPKVVHGLSRFEPDRPEVSVDFEFNPHHNGDLSPGDVAENLNGTINRELACLRRAFRLALDATPQKVVSVPKFELLPEAPPRTGFVELGQYRALLSALPKDLQPVLVVGYHVGARRSEILKMRKSQVDLESGYIRLTQGETKNDAGRVLPIYGEMIETINEALKTAGPYLFPRADGDPIVELRPAWDDACVEAGVPGLLLHDLRRSAARNMARAGIPQAVRMKILGHKTDSMERRYNIVDEQDLESVKDVMTAFMKTKAKKATE